MTTPHFVLLFCFVFSFSFWVKFANYSNSLNDEVQSRIWSDFLIYCELHKDSLNKNGTMEYKFEMLWNDYCHFRIDFYNTMYEFEDCKRLNNYFGEIFFNMESDDGTGAVGFTDIMAFTSTHIKNKNKNTNDNTNNSNGYNVSRLNFSIKEEIYLVLWHGIYKFLLNTPRKSPTKTNKNDQKLRKRILESIEKTGVFAGFKAVDAIETKSAAYEKLFGDNRLEFLVKYCLTDIKDESIYFEEEKQDGNNDGTATATTASYKKKDAIYLTIHRLALLVFYVIYHRKPEKGSKSILDVNLGDNDGETKNENENECPKAVQTIWSIGDKLVPFCQFLNDFCIYSVCYPSKMKLETLKRNIRMNSTSLNLHFIEQYLKFKEYICNFGDYLSKIVFYGEGTLLHGATKQGLFVYGKFLVKNANFDIFNIINRDRESCYAVAQRYNKSLLLNYFDSVRNKQVEYEEHKCFPCFLCFLFFVCCLILPSFLVAVVFFFILICDSQIMNQK